MLDPKFTESDIQSFDTDVLQGRGLDGKEVTAGCIGVTALSAISDPFNAVLQILAHVPPIRDYFALRSNYKLGKDSLVDMFAITVRKLWNYRGFRSYTSSLALLQTATLHPERQFKLASRTDAMDLMVWMLNALHLGMVSSAPGPGGEKKRVKESSARISSCFAFNLRL